ncbi:MAG: hypothetical protein GEU80_07030 [Dehalococcoidia bacterium]|nr:hypothetical protein [Dehalococcoidia bacterium]
MPARARALLTYGVILTVVFLGTAAAGFVYQHEPERDQLVLQLDRQDDGGGAQEVLIGGSVVAVDGARLVIRTDQGDLTFDVPTDTPLEVLERLEGGALVEGSQVNVGAARTEFGLVLTGVVMVEAAP